MNQLKERLLRSRLDCMCSSCSLLLFSNLGYPNLSGKQRDLVFGIIISCTPPLIVAGLGTFGYYTLSGDYDRKND
jgi:hypothetical protein